MNVSEADFRGSSGLSVFPYRRRQWCKVFGVKNLHASCCNDGSCWFRCVFLFFFEIHKTLELKELYNNTGFYGLQNLENKQVTRKFFIYKNLVLPCGEGIGRRSGSVRLLIFCFVCQRTQTLIRCVLVRSTCAEALANAASFDCAPSLSSVKVVRHKESDGGCGKTGLNCKAIMNGIGAMAFTDWRFPVRAWVPPDILR